MKKSSIFLSFCLMVGGVVFGQQEIKLYPKGPKESNELKVAESYRDPEFIVNISEPRMYVYQAPAEKSNGVSVIICPGGGYAGVSQIKEGSDIAKWYNDLGITAFVLYYRMPNGHYKVPLKDVQTAFKIVRKNAKSWNLDKSKIGIMGFSAGGHLASTAGTHFGCCNKRPAFMILGYPVVTMDSTYTHMGSRNNLLGKNPSEKLVKLYSNELQVKKNTPPTFIVHAKDDKAVPIANSENLAKAIEAKHIPVKLVEYDKGGHGFGMRKHNIPADNWPDELKAWLIAQNLVKQ